MWQYTDNLDAKDFTTSLYGGSFNSIQSNYQNVSNYIFNAEKNSDSNIILDNKQNNKTDELNNIVGSFESKKKSYSIDFNEIDKLKNFIFNTFNNEEIDFESTPKIKYIIDNISKEVGYSAIDVALINILVSKILLSDTNNIIKFMAFLSSMNDKDIPLTSVLSVTSLYVNKNISVKEKVLEMTEQWENPDMIEYLEMMDDFNRPHLQKYKLEVIEYLKDKR